MVVFFRSLRHELSKEDLTMVGFRPVCLALGLCAIAGTLPPAMAADPQEAHPGLRILKVKPGPAPMTVATATPGILDYDGIPTVENTNAANVGGLMYYCYHKHLVTDTTVRALGRKLAERNGIQNDPDYAWGGAGMLKIGAHQMFDLKSLNHDQRAAVCSRSALRGPDLLKEKQDR